MLCTLKIHNLAIVDELEIEFSSGLNILTGETGAGKSIVIKAIELLTGKRAAADIVRTGTERCEIEGLFILSEEAKAQLSEDSDDMAEILAEDELLIRRVIDRSGRSKVYLNGRLSTAGLLQNISSPLLDITGQHQHRTLLDSSHHREFLDCFGVPMELRKQTFEAYRTWLEAKQHLDRFLTDTEARALYFDRIRSEHKELIKAQLEPNERDEIETELKRLSNYETITQNISQALSIADEDETNLDSQFRVLNSLIESSLAFDPTLSPILSLLESSYVQLSEAKLGLSEYLSNLDVDPERLEYLRERLSEIARLERKYQKSLPELLIYFEQISSELSEYDAGAFDEKQLKARAEKSRMLLDELEAKLRAKRLKAAATLTKESEKELKTLNMKRARFSVDITPTASGPSGADDVSFMLSANPGEPLKPISKVASGGELSRILLVLKTLLNEQTSPATQIYDEIDTGIGGAVAHVVGEKLRQVALQSQVIAITHAPQIAALGEQHFLIAKTSAKNTTQVSVVPLDEPERVAEIARMLAGKRISSKFEESARELLRARLEFSSNSRQRA